VGAGAAPGAMRLSILRVSSGRECAKIAAY